MVWSKMKQQLESFLSPSLVGRVEYRASSYRYLPDKSGQSYLMVDKKEIFNMRDLSTGIRWYQTEQEIKNDPNILIPISEEDIERVRKETKGLIPEDRLALIARNHKFSICTKELIGAQTVLSKSNFYQEANAFLTDSIENNLKSKDALLNILALVDRRVGKKRLLSIEEEMRMKLPVVQYFYDLRRRTAN